VVEQRGALEPDLCGYVLQARGDKPATGEMRLSRSEDGGASALGFGR
jgi:hypothetical protein